MNDKKFIEIEKISMEISSLARYGRTMEGKQEKRDIFELIKIEVMSLIPLMPKKRRPTSIGPSDVN